MAIDLEPNTNYQLVSGDHLCQDKLIVHVKLTDSCLRALQGFKNIEARSKHTPLIKFTGQNGRITIPTNSDIRQQFMFNCSTLQARDSQGCLDCIQQSSNNKTAVSFGSITHKINILATDDSYKMTQDKMKVAEEERKEVRTRVISLSQGKVKKNRHITRQNNILKSVKGKLPTVSKISNGASKSLRDRVIHLLAVRPFKKPELIDRLSKDGVRLDKHALTHILQQITTLDNNQYNLMKHIYTEIKIDSWPYTDSEKQSVQQRIINSQAEPRTYLQKNESIKDKPAESKNKKRLSESIPYSNPAIKRQRIARTVMSNNNVTKEQKRKDNPSKTISVKTEKQSNPSTQGNNSSDSPVDYKKKYQPITTCEQRKCYRQDFEIEYKEYLELQHKINAVTKKFEELKESLEKCPQNSKEREVIGKQVVALYQKQQQDPSWEINKKRCRDLHSKLAYIKELIKEYDGKRQDTL